MTVSTQGQSLLNVKFQLDSYLKKRPVSSEQLAEDEKVKVAAGKQYLGCVLLAEDAGHKQVALPGNAGIWWIWPSHCIEPSELGAGSDKGNPLKGFVHWDQKDNDSDGWRECQSSSIAMCLHYLGIGNLKDDQDYVSLVEKHGDTTEREPHFAAMRELGYSGASWHTGLSIAEIKAEILKGKPVAVGSLHHGPVSACSGGGHFVVITGFGPGYWVVQDPYGSQDLVNGGWSNQALGAGKDQHYSFKNFNPRIFVEGDGSCWGWTFA